MENVEMYVSIFFGIVGGIYSAYIRYKTGDWLGAGKQTAKLLEIIGEVGDMIDENSMKNETWKRKAESAGRERAAEFFPSQLLQVENSHSGDAIRSDLSEQTTGALYPCCFVWSFQQRALSAQVFLVLLRS